MKVNSGFELIKVSSLAEALKAVGIGRNKKQH